MTLGSVSALEKENKNTAISSVNVNFILCF
jgi:hypothetical protein